MSRFGIRESLFGRRLHPRSVLRHNHHRLPKIPLTEQILSISFSISPLASDVPRSMANRDPVHFASFNLQQSAPETVFLSDIGPDGQLARKRKAHTKSRSGCVGCKARKVKVCIYMLRVIRQIRPTDSLYTVRRGPAMSELREEKSGMCPYLYHLSKIDFSKGTFKQASPRENS